MNLDVETIGKVRQSENHRTGPRTGTIHFYALWCFRDAARPGGLQLANRNRLVSFNMRTIGWIIRAGRNPRENPVFQSTNAAVLLVHLRLTPGLRRVLLPSWRIRGHVRCGVGRDVHPHLGCGLALAPRRLHRHPAWSGRTFRWHHAVPVTEEAMILKTPNQPPEPSAVAVHSTRSAATPPGDGGVVWV